MDLNRIHALPLSYRILIMAGGFLLVFLLLYFFVISSLLNQLHEAQNHEQDLKNQLSGMVNTQVNEQKKLVQYKEVDTLLKTWQKKLFSYDELPEFMDKILKIGSENHIEFTLFSPAPAVKDKDSDYFKVPVKVVALGSYDNLAKLVSQIAVLPGVAVIRDFTLTNEVPPEALDPQLAKRLIAEQLLMLDMMLEIYYLPNPKDPNYKEIMAKEEKSKPATNAKEGTAKDGPAKEGATKNANPKEQK